MTATTPSPARDDQPGSATPERSAAGGATSAAGDATGKDAARRTPPEFRRVWLLAIVRGVLLLVLGLLLLIDPVRGDLATMRWVLGAFMIVDGLVAALAALWHRNQSSWQVWLTQTAVDVVLGVVVLAWPDLTPKALYYVLAAWVVALGVTLIVTAGVLARSRDLEWSWALTAGVVSFLFGVLLVLRQPSDEGDVQQTTALVFAFYAWVAGAIYVVTGFATRTLALELRSLRAQLAERGGSTAPARLVLGGVGEGAPRPAGRTNPPATGTEGRRTTPDTSSASGRRVPPTEGAPSGHAPARPAETSNGVAPADEPDGGADPSSPGRDRPAG